MKEPFVMKRKDGSQKVSIDGLKTFIKEVYIKDYNDMLNNSLYLKEHTDNLEKVARAVIKAHNRTDSKSSLTVLGIIGLGFLWIKGYSKHAKDIEELKKQHESLMEDHADLREKIDELEAELYEMNERLHAVAEKEDKKEG